MKATFGVLLLCLAYACAAAVDNKSPELEKLVEEQKVVVEGMYNDVLKEQKTLVKDVETKLEETKKEAKKDMKIIIDAGHKDIIERYEISEKKDSKEVKQCFNNAEVQFVNIEKKVNELVDICFRQATIHSDGALDYLISLAKYISSTTDDLNAIIPQCKDADSAKMEKCVESKLASIKSTKIEPFPAKVEIVKNIVKKSIVATVDFGKVCKISVFNTAQESVFGLKGIRSNAALCIWIAEPSLPSA